eukprot:CAMPEP_0118972884 /NCGR_PEP_ID=MMETSP1173-20130426/9057_1 /TAXON_ID=1034831 /ORGANISM="Rhizochromulina marina cf, Strain CCMP1243" /LENGTH=117 /DNA_ID=CAMNT_0006922473 /DNA_START=180 /DNA_END=531 /DNA_ORIENTATION=-
MYDVRCLCLCLCLCGSVMMVVRMACVFDVADMLQQISHAPPDPEHEQPEHIRSLQEMRALPLLERALALWVRDVPSLKSQATAWSSPSRVLWNFRGFGRSSISVVRVIIIPPPPPIP